MNNDTSSNPLNLTHPQLPHSNSPRADVSQKPLSARVWNLWTHRITKKFKANSGNSPN